MLDAKRGLRKFLLGPQSSVWLAVLRIGLGLQVLLYAISLRGDWLEILGRENQGLIRRDLVEAMLSADSPFIPRVGWIVDAGAHLCLTESAVLWLVWITLIVAASLVVRGAHFRQYLERHKPLGGARRWQEAPVAGRSPSGRRPSYGVG